MKKNRVNDNEMKDCKMKDAERKDNEMGGSNMKDNSMRRTMILTTIVCLIPVVMGILLYPRLPDTIVTHWDGNGNPNGWSSKFTGAIVFPVGLVLVDLVFPVLLKTDPKYANMNEKLKHLVYWIIPVVSVFCSGTTLAAALGHQVDILHLGPMFMGVLFMAIGNYLPKNGQSYTMGIKLPWTLHSEENWNRTHRLAGRVWMLGGLCMVIAGACNLGSAAILTIAVLLVGIPVVYSYLLYRKGV